MRRSMPQGAREVGGAGGEAPKAFLEVRNGGLAGLAYPLRPDEPTLVGRSVDADLTLVDEGVSREHALLVYEDGAYVIEDLQSTNGTIVNGRRVRSARLADGDEIRLGRTLLRFRLERP